MRWVLIVIGALVLLPLVFSLLKFATSLAMGILHIAVILAVVIFLVGLIRRMLVPRVALLRLLEQEAPLDSRPA